MIVHGGVPDTKKKSDLISKTRAYLRRALLKLLSYQEEFNPELIETFLLNKE